LLETLKMLRHGWKRTVAAGEKRGIMVVGKSTNVEFQFTNEHLVRGDMGLASDEDVTALGAKGEIYRSDAKDYFIYSRGAEDWAHVPDFVVGRRAYDDWLVDHAYHDAKVDLIDATSTVLALHLTAKDGNLAEHDKAVDNDWNILALNPTTRKPVNDNEWDNGKTGDCPFFTRRHGTAIAVQVRPHHASILGRSLPHEVYSLDETAPSTPVPAAADPDAVAAAQVPFAAKLPPAAPSAPPLATPPPRPSPTSSRNPSPPPEGECLCGDRSLFREPNKPIPNWGGVRTCGSELSWSCSNDAKEQAPAVAWVKKHCCSSPPSAKGVNCGAVANIFTTFIENTKDHRKINAQMEVLKAHQRLRPHGVQTWLFTKSDDWAAKAEVCVRVRLRVRVCVCVCVCVLMYVCIFTYMHACMHTYKQTYIHK
jgi:hypothetical protein